MNKYLLFIVLILLLCSFIFLSNYLLISENLYFNTFSNQFTFEQIQSLIIQGRKWIWVTYIILPILTLIKITLVASCLSIGQFFFINQFAFKQAFRTALLAEFIFLVPVLMKILWFAIIQTDYSLQDLQVFHPLSALNLFDYKTVQPWLIYPLQLLNAFEILYWLLLAKGLSKISFSTKDGLQYEMNFDQSFGIVASSYGTGLLLWVAVVMFITVSFTP